MRVEEQLRDQDIDQRNTNQRHGNRNAPKEHVNKGDEDGDHSQFVQRQ